MIQRIFALDEPPAEAAAESSGYGLKEDFELVVGRRQVAALAFLGLVTVVVCSGMAYLAGKALSARAEAAEPVIRIEQPPAPLPPEVPMVEATIVRAPVASDPKPEAEAPIFANPNPQAIYIQVGAVEKGVAIVIAEGLRRHALDSFVAPGPSTKTYRVLIGPFRDVEAYNKARNIVAEIGLDSFARRYQSQ